MFITRKIYSAKALLLDWQKNLSDVVTIVAGLAMILAFSFPYSAFADIPVYGEAPGEQKAIINYVDYMQNKMRDFGSLPGAGSREPTRVMSVSVTAYTSDPWETDSTPTVTASGTQVRHGVIAANFLPKGTFVRIPDVYGDDIFVVEDRMNKRYNEKVDIWMEDKIEARQFGLQYLEIEIF